MFKEKELKSSHPCICLKLDWNKVENTLLQTVIVIYYVESKNHPKRIWASNYECCIGCCFLDPARPQAPSTKILIVRILGTSNDTASCLICQLILFNQPQRFGLDLQSFHLGMGFATIPINHLWKVGRSTDDTHCTSLHSKLLFWCFPIPNLRSPRSLRWSRGK